jgi:hypothetical protein
MESTITVGGTRGCKHEEHSFTIINMLATSLRIIVAILSGQLGHCRAIYAHNLETAGLEQNSSLNGHTDLLPW